MTENNCMGQIKFIENFRSRDGKRALILKGYDTISVSQGDCQGCQLGKLEILHRSAQLTWILMEICYIIIVGFLYRIQ